MSVQQQVNVRLNIIPAYIGHPVWHLSPMADRKISVMWICAL